MSYTVSVDKDVCISSGNCVANAPDAFRFDDDDLSEAVSPTPPISDERLLAVARDCPSGAIRVFDERGTDLVD